MTEAVSRQDRRNVQGPWNDLALHTIGWKAFQDLSGQICDVILGSPVEAFRETGDQGLDGFLYRGANATPTALQCKYSSIPGRAASLSDIKSEEKKIKKLIEESNIKSYLYMTNCSLSAETASEIRKYLLNLGITKPHVIGKQYIVRAIRSSNKLRALVPQVYGLGDLSMIMDQRKAEQTSAILGHWKTALQSYVPTRPHRAAVQSLMDHGIVLLLGNPATGKSTLAAVLTTLASELEKGHRYKVSGARQLLKNWNPNEKGGFYWVDDAFGANQLREDHVSDWAEMFEDLSAALAAGNKFVLTSRRHIYVAAQRRLGTRNLHVLSSGAAVVKVDTYKTEEKSRILYNLIKFGKQNSVWKSMVKSFLPEVSEIEPFVPGVIKRLADPAFTKRLPMTKQSFLAFLKEPKTHLFEVVSELNPAQQAALSLIFVSNGLLPKSAVHSDVYEKVENLYKVDKTAIGLAFIELKGAFVEEYIENGAKYWIYEHPTISDAVTEYIRRNESMLELFVEGANINTLLNNLVCDGSAGIEDAMVLPELFNERVIERIARSEDNNINNPVIYSFVAQRSSNKFLTELMARIPNLFDRPLVFYGSAASNVKILAAAKILELGLLNPSVRVELADVLESSIEEVSDSSILYSNPILSLLEPKRLIVLGSKLVTEIIPRIPDIAERLGNEAELDGDPDDTFSDLVAFLAAARELAENFGFDENVLNNAEMAIDEALDDLSRRKRQKEEEEEDAGESDDYSYNKAFGHSSNYQELIANHKINRPRSIFDDIDE